MSEYLDAFLAEDTENDTEEYLNIRSSKSKEFHRFLKNEFKSYDNNFDFFLEDFPCIAADKVVDLFLFEQDFRDNVLYPIIHKCFYVEGTPNDNDQYRQERSSYEKRNEYDRYLLRKYGNSTLDYIAEKENTEYTHRIAFDAFHEHLENKRIEREETNEFLNYFEKEEKEIIKNFQDGQISEKSMKKLLDELRDDLTESLES